MGDSGTYPRPQRLSTANPPPNPLRKATAPPIDRKYGAPQRLHDSLPRQGSTSHPSSLPREVSSGIRREQSNSSMKNVIGGAGSSSTNPQPAPRPPLQPQQHQPLQKQASTSSLASKSGLKSQASQSSLRPLRLSRGVPAPVPTRPSKLPQAGIPLVEKRYSPPHQLSPDGTFDELRMARNVSISEGLLSAPTLPSKHATKAVPWIIRLDNLLSEHGKEFIWCTIWILVQVGLFAYNFITMQNDVGFASLVAATNGFWATAKASAAVISLNMALVLIPILRTLLSLISDTFLARLYLFNSSALLHRVCSYGIVFWSFVHCVAHYMNYIRIEAASGRTLLAGAMTGTTGAGITGQMLVLLMVAIYTSSANVVKRSGYNVFWSLHCLFIVLYALIVIHGSLCFGKALDVKSGSTICRTPTSWMYWIGPLVLYGVELVLRTVRARQTTTVLKVIQHPQKTVEINFYKPAMKTRVAQYVYLKCPDAGIFEWHPFTLTSAPREDCHSVHVRVVGDWSARLADRLNCRFDPDDQRPPFPKNYKLMVDGPFGRSGDWIFRFDTVILIGAGIGVTPCASILKEIAFRYVDPKIPRHMKKVYFFWVCREAYAFKWFRSFLAELEEESQNWIDPDLFEIRPYLTGNQPNIDNLFLNDFDGDDALTRLRARTQYGRPRFDALFRDIRQQHPNTDVGVYFSGPPGFGSEIQRVCDGSSTVSSGTRFFFSSDDAW
ncbi:hypothetical protein SmJEL517_g04608 [Synchytrium microbalum]|uniref:FAD-binding FR-type domain-containing protein n=1 Tax=Synchytrium microbalum TaxID=1806994 RepID=A0A507BXR5_9FUNG|nr:uncharacterized protein SmJEL517_g04608 [Synchytrium microbalum]TPX32222.1 hypothetical protein SmJEL517_g04608 [Synchytrium microbalum]